MCEARLYTPIAFCTTSRFTIEIQLAGNQNCILQTARYSDSFIIPQYFVGRVEETFVCKIDITM